MPADAPSEYQGAFATGEALALKAAPVLMTTLIADWGQPGWVVLAAIFLLPATRRLSTDQAPEPPAHQESDRHRPRLTPRASPHRVRAHGGPSREARVNGGMVNRKHGLSGSGRLRGLTVVRGPRAFSCDICRTASGSAYAIGKFTRPAMAIPSPNIVHVSR
jgi:hypothetical protein